MENGNWQKEWSFITWGYFSGNYGDEGLSWRTWSVLNQGRLAVHGSFWNRDRLTVSISIYDGVWETWPDLISKTKASPVKLNWIHIYMGGSPTGNRSQFAWPHGQAGWRSITGRTALQQEGCNGEDCLVRESHKVYHRRNILCNIGTPVQSGTCCFEG